jgi:hypothetical protein
MIDFRILLRCIQLTHVQRYRGSTVKMVLSCKIVSLNEANTVYTRMWCSPTPAGVRCVHFPITTIMDHKPQLIKPLNKSELYTTRSRTTLDIILYIELAEGVIVLRTVRGYFMLN